MKAVTKPMPLRFLEVGITLSAAFLVSLLYYFAITYFVAGTFLFSDKPSDIPDIFILAVEITFFVEVFRYGCGRSRAYLLTGLGLVIVAMLGILYINRTLGISPESGVVALYLPVLLLSTCSWTVTLFGYKILINSQSMTADKKKYL